MTRAPAKCSVLHREYNAIWDSSLIFPCSLAAAILSVQGKKKIHKKKIEPCFCSTDCLPEEKTVSIECHRSCVTLRLGQREEEKNKREHILHFHTDLHTNRVINKEKY